MPAGFSYMVDVEVSETECSLQQDFNPDTCQPQARYTETDEFWPEPMADNCLVGAGLRHEIVHGGGARG